MSIQYIGLNEINGPLIALEHVNGASFDEVAVIKLQDGSERTGRVVEMSGDKVILQVFEGTKGLSLKNTKTSFTGKPLEIPLSEDILGRVFNGAGKPIDNLGYIYPEKFADINGKPLNPVSRTYPRNYINTGISSIDALVTLIRGQKLPIFSISGEPYNQLLARIALQAEVDVIILGGMGLKYDDYLYFKNTSAIRHFRKRLC